MTRSAEQAQLHHNGTATEVGGRKGKRYCFSYRVLVKVFRVTYLSVPSPQGVPRSDSLMSASTRRTLLIYAAVPDRDMLNQGFYAAEADGLRAHPCVGQVRLTNRLRDVARGDFDGVIGYFYTHSALACMLARLHGRPSIATGGAEQVFPELASGWRRLARIIAFHLTAVFARRIVATSTTDLAQMRSLVWFAGDKLMMTFHGAAAVEQAVAAPSDDRTPGSFVTICGLDTSLNIARKGVPEALELLARAIVDCPTAFLTIIGRTTCRSVVEDHARLLGVADRVRFAGYVTEVQKLALLRRHKYYVQMSVYEGFGIGALEALAQGCQVIHSGAGGLADTIADFGVVVPRERVRDFELGALPPYTAPGSPAITRHLARFSPSMRADAILEALFGQ
jgi:hypothetical protein